MLARLTMGGSDYRVDQIPDGVLGQSYVVLARSDSGFGTGQIIADPAVIEVICFFMGGIGCEMAC